MNHSAPPGAPTAPIGRIPVAKKLESGRPGTQRYKRQFGDALVCVRYRKDPDTGTRYTTVEIVVDERQLTTPVRANGVAPEEIVAVTIGYAETELRNRVKQAGARWDTARKVWLLPYGTALELGLHGRVKKLRREDGDG